MSSSPRFLFPSQAECLRHHQSPITGGPWPVCKTVNELSRKFSQYLRKAAKLWHPPCSNNNQLVPTFRETLLTALVRVLAAVSAVCLSVCNMNCRVPRFRHAAQDSEHGQYLARQHGRYLVREHGQYTIILELIMWQAKILTLTQYPATQEHTFCLRRH